LKNRRRFFTPTTNFKIEKARYMNIKKIKPVKTAKEVSVIYERQADLMTKPLIKAMLGIMGRSV